MKKNFSIAIDGPVGVGKGTLAVTLSKRLNALYVYTGGMYRALTLSCLQEKIDLRKEDQVLDVFSRNKIDLKISDYGTRVYLNDKEVSDEIFSKEVSNSTPIIAAYAKVRRQMVEKQRHVAEGRKVIIEGRDSATDVIPNADLKIFLTAGLKVRAQRRLKQILAKGIKTTIEEVKRDTQRRDMLDMEREASPLTIVKDAFVLDTTNLTIEETVDRVMEELKERKIIDD
ncbi:MAG: (d)CMP kinase [Candidatus Levybacteria bacterium]|nr:(d)CMP kinase [Candidatus Levybacteria bacterium]